MIVVFLSTSTIVCLAIFFLFAHTRLLSASLWLSVLACVVLLCKRLSIASFVLFYVTPDRDSTMSPSLTPIRLCRSSLFLFLVTQPKLNSLFSYTPWCSHEPTLLSYSESVSLSYFCYNDSPTRFTLNAHLSFVCIDFVCRETFILNYFLGGITTSEPPSYDIHV